ncbi:MAG: lipid-binding SYLF domain-containing protein [Rhodospirillales bacterium]|jgi:lipid-binding SYLF domain-containing protein|nr:lipid-binding SYLF domain-containing protein [Rhodospirillales bacterium]
MKKLKFRRAFPALVLAATLVLGGCLNTSRTATTSQALVDGATKTLRALKARENLHQFPPLLRQAAGVAIFPALYKGGFLVGVEGGHGVLLSRKPDGTWSYPAFYSMAAGSFGMQMGAQKSEVVLIIRNPGALKAILRHQGKLGADAGVAVAWEGAGVEGAVTTNMGMDVWAFSNNVGLYGGASLEGAAIVRRNDLNQEYYGVGATPEKIVLAHQLSNAQADGLRQELASR